MFMRIKFVTTTTTDVLGTPHTQKTQTYYLIDGQVPDEKTTHPFVQQQYKTLYDKQEEETLKRGYPVTLFEILGAIPFTQEVMVNSNNDFSEINKSE